MAARCTEVSPLCPVEYTTLGYYPNKPLNIFCAVAFGLALIIQLVIGIWKKTYAFTGFIVAGCALEVAGAYLFSLVDDMVTTIETVLYQQRRPSLVLSGVADSGFM